jgi:hypothetical protein
LIIQGFHSRGNFCTLRGSIPASGTICFNLGDGNNPNNDQRDLAADRDWVVIFTIVR